MRLLTRGKLYRAFPELDGISDDHCRRLLERFGLRLRSIRAVAFALCSLGLSAALIVTAAPWVVRVEDRIFTQLLSEPSPSTWPLFLAAVGFNAMLIVLPMFSGLLARDLMLRVQLQGFLAHYRPSARCRRCGYLLSGHGQASPVRRRCPECGETNLVEAAPVKSTSSKAGRIRHSS